MIDKNMCIIPGCGAKAELTGMLAGSRHDGAIAGAAEYGLCVKHFEEHVMNNKRWPDEVTELLREGLRERRLCAMKAKSRLIALEGIDGSGKSTQAALLCDRLGLTGRPCVSFHEPTQGRYGEAIRLLAKKGELHPKVELEYFVLDRMDDVAQNINPALAAGSVVVMDRYYYSTVAYQTARGFDSSLILSKNEGFAPRPDLCIILDLPADEAVRRVRGRGTCVEHFENLEYLAKVRDEFLRLQGDNVIVVDATQSKAEVSEMIWKAVCKVL